MEPLISKLQVKPADRSTGPLLEQANLTKLLIEKPEEIEPVISAALAKSSTKNTLDYIIESMGGPKGELEIGKEEVQWDYSMRPDNSWPITKSATEIYGQSSTINLGYNNQEFQVGVGDDAFVVDDVITSERDDYKMRVAKIHQDGLNYILTLQLINPNVSFIPSTQLETGMRLIRRFTGVAEGSHRGGHAAVSSPIKLRNCLTTLRMSYAVTRSARVTPMTIEMINPNDPTGPKITYWADYAFWEMMEQWGRDRSYAGLESVYNKGLNLSNLVKDSANRPIFYGAGLLDQISPSNIFTHNGVITYRTIEKWFSQLAMQTSQYGTNVEFTLFAGTGLFRLISNALLDHYKGIGLTNVLQTGATFLKGEGDSLELYQPIFKKINMDNGLVVNLVRFDPFSDIQMYPEKVGNSFETRKSYEGFIINLSNSIKGQRNLQKVYRAKSKNKMWEVAGSIDSQGNTPKLSASGWDGAETHLLTEEGYLLKDPLGSARIIPTF